MTMTNKTSKLPNEGTIGEVPGIVLGWYLGVDDGRHRDVTAASVIEVTVHDDGPHFKVLESKAWRSTIADEDALRGLAAAYGIQWSVEAE